MPAAFSGGRGVTMFQTLSDLRGPDVPHLHGAERAHSAVTTLAL